MPRHKWNMSASRDARARAVAHKVFLSMVRKQPVSSAILAGTEGCRWICADPRAPHAKWCGRPCASGRSYCEAHTRKAYEWVTR